MFLGHAAVAFAAKSAAPKTSIGTLLMAAQFIDLLWPVFLLLGLEHVRIDPGNTAMTPLDFYDYPLSHSLLGTVVWALLFGVTYLAVRRYRRGAAVLAALVISHWVLDLVTHGPDPPLSPASESGVGLGLWNSVPATVAVEGLLFAGCLALYSRTTRAIDRTGTWSLWGLVTFLVVVYAANTFGPPPPDVNVIAYAGNASWLFVIWGYWIDRHRVVRESSPAAALQHT
jgi:membrane-bound metal-dependent hydrolase YbcI (DUF457 family)